jgi:hypothetical protein
MKGEVSIGLTFLSLTEGVSYVYLCLEIAMFTSYGWTVGARCLYNK